MSKMVVLSCTSLLLLLAAGPHDEFTKRKAVEAYEIRPGGSDDATVCR